MRVEHLTAERTSGNRIYVAVGSKSTSNSNAVDVQFTHAPATLAPPPVTFEDLLSQLSVGLGI
jgi:hypothetical protein